MSQLAQTGPQDDIDLRVVAPPTVRSEAGVQRLPTLDALRGIAALSVLFFHCAGVFSGFVAPSGSPFSADTWSDPWVVLKYTPLRLLVAGPSAVMLFFVLSGFVLSLPLLRHRQPSYLRYIIKRCCRVYLPFACAIIVSACLYVVLRPLPVPGASIWINENSWTHPITADYLLGHFMMTGLPQQMTLDNVMWSLVHEMRVSIVFPFLWMFVHRARTAALLATLALFFLCRTIASDGPDTVLAAIASTGCYVLLFVFGIIMAEEAGRITRIIAALPAAGRAALLVGSLAMLVCPTALLLAPLLQGIGAVGIVALALGSPTAQRFLTTPSLVWLGRISYGLYLFHLLILLSAIHLLAGSLPLWMIVCGVVPASLLGAELAYRFIELPAIRLGRFLLASEPNRAALTPPAK